MTDIEQQDNQFDLAKFSPTKADLELKLQEYAELKINGIDDGEGFELVKNALNIMLQLRKGITERLKSMREQAIKFQRDVVSVEKEYLELIKKYEDVLKKEKDEYQENVEKAKRMKVLPQRKDELAKINVVLEDDVILGMSSDEFNKYIIDERQRQLDEREAKIKEAELEDQRKADEEVRVEREKKIAEEAAEKARIDTENRMKQEQAEKEAREAKAREDAERVKKEEDERLAKKKKYQSRLQEQNYNEATDKIERVGDKVILYRRISDFII